MIWASTSSTITTSPMCDPSRNRSDLIVTACMLPFIPCSRCVIYRSSLLPTPVYIGSNRLLRRVRMRRMASK